MGDDSDLSDRRHIDVPMPIFKAVTVFTTLFAVVAIIVALLLIDHGTDRARAPPDEVNVWVTVLGVVLIVLAAAVYAFSTRFTPAERANDKGGSSQSDNDG